MKEKIKIDKSLLSGSTAMLILKLLETKDMYGYLMIETLEKQSNNVFTLKAGTLYPLLHGLEKKSMIESYDDADTDNIRPRKYYTITKSGRKFLKEKENEWEIYSSAVKRVIGGGINYVRVTT
jgi:DNA-binding PadR family transcriptional regulator